MPKNKDQDYEIKIGDKTYYGKEFENLKLQNLIREWQKFNYSKFSNLEHQMQWAIMEVLLLEDFKLTFIQTSNIEYPSLPYDNLENASKLIDAADKAKAHLKGFEIPSRILAESIRMYQARISDELERHLVPKINKLNASLVGDYYLCRCIKDPPLGYDE